MPFLCCGAKKEDVVGDAPAATTTSLPKDFQQADSTRRKEEEQLAASVYHDARQSLTESMIYRPARSVIGYRALNLDTQPEQLLKKGGGTKDSVVVVQQDLEKADRVVVQEGYPGSLTQTELEACLEFRKQVKEKKGDEPSYYQMVHALEGCEDEAFAICRFLRARKFVVNDTMTLMTGNLETWKEGHAHKYYPNLETADALGAHCPRSVIDHLVPILQSGLANNGSLVFYFPVGMVSLEAIDCLTDLTNFKSYIWNLLAHRFKACAAQAQARKPDVTILSELTVVVDLKGIERSLFTEGVMSILKTVVGVLNCFPEFLNKAMVINAPFFFSAIWMILKQFIDARTTAKIDIFSYESKGIHCMQQYIPDEALLSNYGGKGPSYDEILHGLRQEGTSRQSVERLFVPHKGTESVEVELTAQETATVMVFTRSAHGAHFSVTKDGSMVQEMEVKPQENGGGGHNGIPQYAREVASGVQGPGKISISATSASHHKEYFVVQVRVYAA